MSMSTPSDPSRDLPRKATFWVASAVLATAYVAAFRWTWIDDAMITLTYARNLAEGAGFSLVPGVSHYGFTSPLNVFLLAGVGSVVGFDHAIATTTVGLILLLLLASRRLSSRLFDDPAPGTALAIVIAANPLMASTFGLEVLLGAVLSVFLLGAWLDHHAPSLGLLLGLLLLTRPDYGTVAVVALLIVPSSKSIFGLDRVSVRSSARWRFVLRGILWAAPLVLLWHSFAWIALGSALPVTFLIKLAQSPWGGFHFANGPWMYLRGATVATLGTVLPLLGLVGLLRAPRGLHASLAWAALCFGAVHFLGLVPLRVPPYHWYYLPSLTFFLIAAWVGACSFSPPHRRQAALLLAAIGALPFALVAAQRGLPLDEAPIHTNWATLRDYREMGRWLAEHISSEADVEIIGEIGTLAYSSRLRLIDHFSHPSAFPDLRHKAGFAPSTRNGRIKAINFFFHPGAGPVRPEWCLRGRQGSFEPGADVTRSWQSRTAGGRTTTWTLSRCGAGAAQPPADAQR